MDWDGLLAWFRLKEAGECVICKICIMSAHLISPKCTHNSPVPAYMFTANFIIIITKK